ncbi:MAG: hypothetical protein LBL75_03100 [Rickettsiales bacterium]|jgi:hypothetical protein|nr:hypothetical protein [Rickettsiales bacterium]
MYDLSQIIIFVCGTISIWLLTSNNKWSKYGPIIGVLMQPAWFYVAIYDNQWGVFAVNVIYLLSYSRGIYTFWFRAKRARRLRKLKKLRQKK